MNTSYTSGGSTNMMQMQPMAAQGTPMGTPYGAQKGTPQMSATSNQINTNQIRQFKMKPVLAFCPKCNKVVMSKVEQSCNCMDFLFFCCCSACWCISKACSDKSYNCKNATHTCSSCGHILYQYYNC